MRAAVLAWFLGGVVLVACGGRAFVPQAVRCERGGYLESVAACENLGKNAATDEERLRFKVLAGRNQMWSCSNLESSECSGALDSLWFSTDPQEVTTMLAMSHKACAAGVDSGCTRARDAAWLGRGTSIDALASVGWHQKCSRCDKTNLSWIEHANEPMGLKIDAATRLARARKIATLGAHGPVTALITNELAMGVLAGREAEANALLLGAVTSRWALEVEPLIAREPLRALAAAEVLVALAKSDAALAARRDRIRADLAAPALAQLAKVKAAGLPLATWFHAARAAQLVRSTVVPKVDLTTLWAQLPSRPQITLAGNCDWVSAPLLTAYPMAGANLPVTATLTCTSNEKTWSTAEKYTWSEKVKKEKTITVKGTSTTTPGQRLTCTRQNCVPTLNTGPSCYTQTYDCGYSPSVTTTTPAHDVTVTVEERVPRDGTRTVRHRTLAASVSGSLVSATGSVPVDFRRTLDEVEYSSQGDSKSFTSATLASLKGEAAHAVTGRFTVVIEAIRQAEAARELAAAANEQDALRAEEHVLRAVTLGNAGEQLRAIYKISGTVQQLLDGAALVLPDVAAAPQVVAMVPAPQDITGGYALSHYPGEPKVTAEVPVDEDETKGEKGGVFRLIQRTELAWNRSDRVTRTDTGELKSVMLGARIERGWNLTPNRSRDFQFGLKPGFVLGGGGDGDLGGYFEGRVGGAAGMLTNFGQLLLVGGVGYAGMGTRDATGSSALVSKADIFYGVDVRFGLDDGISVDGRLWTLRGGPLGTETRYAAQLLYRRESGAEFGVELSLRAFDDETITGFGVVLRAPDVFAR